MPQRNVSFLISSNPTQGAQPIGVLGNEFKIDMSTFPIRIPKNALSNQISVVNASIPYVSPNITAVTSPINNKFYFQYLTINHVISIPTGLYGLADLAAQISQQLVSLLLPSNLFTFVGNSASQTVSIVFNYTTLQIDFTPTDTFRFLFGFDSGVYPAIPTVLATESVTAQNTANFDQLQTFLISTNLVSYGLPINGTQSSGIIGVIPITSDYTPGSRIAYDPQQPNLVEASDMTGQNRTTATFKLTDQEGRNIDLLGQYWSCVIKFTFDT